MGRFSLTFFVGLVFIPGRHLVIYSEQKKTKNGDNLSIAQEALEQSEGEVLPLKKNSESIA